MALIAGLGLLGASDAMACSGLGKGRLSVAPKLRTNPNQAVNNSIVGLWQSTFTLNDDAHTLFDMSFDTFHADGTEFENASDSPLISAVCQGVWTTTSPKTYKLHHVGWNYDATGTILLGYFSFDQILTLTDNGNGYTGSFTFQPRNLDGSPQGPPTEGSVVAVRITAD